jgi:hypothetical protein
VPQFSFLHIILGDETVLAPDAHVYQRLLALDDQEAHAVADLYLENHSLTELYDLVIIPALTMAEQDRHKGALEPARREFVFLSIKEMVVEFSEKAVRASLEGAEMPSAGTGRVLVVPANDEADEIAAAMMAQMLEEAGCAAIVFSVEAGREDQIAMVTPDANDIICISAVPPFAFAGAIALNRQLQRRFPLVKVIAGVWGFAGSAERAMQRFQPSQPAELAISLEEALKSATAHLGMGVPVPAAPADA